MRNYVLRPRGSAFGLDVGIDGGEWLVAVKGDLDAGTSERLRACLQTLRGNGVPVVLDLEHVDFVDSAGIGVLVAAHRAAKLTDQSFTIRAPSRAVRRVLDLTGMARLAEVAP